MNVDLVPVACSVTDHNVAVKGLQKSDFILREDAKPQEIKYLWQQAELPLSIGLIIDVSGSQSSLVHKHRHTVAQFLKQVLRPEDRAMIVSVGGQVWSPSMGAWLCRDPTSAMALSRSGIEFVRSAFSQVTSSQPGRKALLILSDGLDTGSDHHLNDAIEAAQSAGVPVYTIKYVDPLLLPFMAVAALKHDMQTLSRETGGVAFGVFHGSLDDVFRQIEEELRNQYVLAYTPSNVAHNGSYRKLEIEVDGRPMLQVRTRKGYREATELVSAMER